ncbi:MAG: hypothetical protein R3E64_05215 [Halioglobus sp.]
MTDRAVLRGRDMVVALALGPGAVVAALAVAGNAHVGEVRRAPAHCRVTGHTVLRGEDMVEGLALCGVPLWQLWQLPVMPT